MHLSEEGWRECIWCEKAEGCQVLWTDGSKAHVDDRRLSHWIESVIQSPARVTDYVKRDLVVPEHLRTGLQLEPLLCEGEMKLLRTVVSLKFDSVARVLVV